MTSFDQNPSISVIIPTWNRASTILVAIKSALEQSLPPLEILVCDDGSTDDTKALVEALKDPRVKWIPGQHGGRPAIPRNRGIKLAAGEWLAFLDSDDAWLPEKLEQQIKAVKISGYLACCTDAWRITPDQEQKKPLLGGESRAIDIASLLLDNRVICSSVLAHRSLFVYAGGFPEATKLKAIEDYALWLRFACKTLFDYVAQPLLNYTDDPINSIRANDCDVLIQRKLVIRDAFFWILCNCPAGASRFFYAQSGIMWEETRRKWEESRKNIMLTLCHFRLFARLFSKLGWL